MSNSPAVYELTRVSLPAEGEICVREGEACAPPSGAVPAPVCEPVVSANEHNANEQDTHAQSANERSVSEWSAHEQSMSMQNANEQNANEQNVRSCALELTDFCFSYPEASPTLAGVNLALRQGSFALLLGPTGCGKTTLLRCCKPEIAPAGKRSGLIALEGSLLDYADERALFPQVGYVFQDPDNQLVCDTVLRELAFALENAGMPPHAMRRRIAEVAAFFGLEGLLHAETAKLSGGQKQIVNLAAVLALRPRLLLLDEPTAQLDPIAEKNFLHALFRVNRELGVTVLVATHAPEPMYSYATCAFAFQAADGAPANSAVSIAGGASVPTSAPSVDGVFAASSESPASSMPSEPSAIDTATILAATAATTSDSSTTSSPALPPTNQRTVARTRDIHFRWSAHSPLVLRGADLHIAEAEIHALLGGNGAGKSTMLRLLAGACKPERGRVENSCAGRLALLPQNPCALFVCDTVTEELAEWADTCGYGEADIRKAIERFGLLGLETLHPFDLSGGQKQCLALAKLLLTKPAMLLLDEPTKGLDAHTKLMLAELLSSLRVQGCSVVLATHDLAFVQMLADCISLLFDGSVVCTEEPNTFFADSLFYRVPTETIPSVLDKDATRV